MKSALEAGIAAAQAGDVRNATILLSNAVRIEPGSELGWLWLGRCLAEPERKVYCFRRALALNPANAEAAQELKSMGVALPPVPEKPPGPGVEAREAPPAPPEAQAAAQPAEVKRAPGRKAVRRKTRKRTDGLWWVFAGLLLLVVLAGSALLVLLSPVGAGLRGGLVGTATGPAPSAPFAQALAGGQIVTSTTSLTTTSTLTSSPTASLTPTLTPTPTRFTATPSATASPTTDSEAARAMILYTRAKSLRDQAVQEQSLERFYDLIEQARECIDEAIALEPENGEYYFTRFRIYETLGSAQDLTANYQISQELALENLRTAVALGGVLFSRAERDIPLTLFSVRRCDEGMAELDQIVQARGASAPPSVGLQYVASCGYLCQGEIGKALEAIEKAQAIEDSDDYQWLQAILLYHAGRKGEALEILNQLITRKPNSFGPRYYLRALIYYEQGRSDLAERDLYFGDANTWNRAGLASYVRAHLALDRGHKEEGIALLQEARITMLWPYHPLEARIDRELILLKAGKPVHIAGEVGFEWTPIPPVAPAATATHRPTRAPGQPFPTPPFPTPASMEQGSGMIQFDGVAYPVFLFQPAQPVRLQEVRSLRLHLISTSGSSGPTIFRTFLWDFKKGVWVMLESLWGDSDIPDPGRFVDEQGRIYVAVRYPVEKRGTILNLAFTLVGVAEDGSEVKFGWGILPAP
ncbi:MAG: tetratricopeptide repeat protein [Chloroflexota bacterium]